MNINLTPELITGVLIVVGSVGLTLKKYGIFTIGKVPERRDCAKQCRDHEVVVRNAALAVTEAKLNSDRLTEDINNLRDDIKDIKTTIEQREHNIQAEFRRIREILGELSGYVKGLHEKDR